MEILFSEDKHILLKPYNIEVKNGGLIHGEPDQHDVHDFFSVLEHDSVFIFYDISMDTMNDFSAVGDRFSREIDVYLADISHGFEHHLSLLEHLGGAKFIIPFPTITQGEAVAFCREIMMKRIGIPKYFVPGQSLSLL